MSTIIVGAGIGGLTLGALLSSVAGQRVLIFETESEVGGNAREIESEGRFALGAFHVGSAEPGSRLRQLIDQACGEPVAWTQLPFELEKIVFEDCEFSFPSCEKELELRLIHRFPKEQENLKKYFRAVRASAKGFLLWQMAEIMPQPLRFLLPAYVRLFHPEMFRTTEEVFKKTVEDPQLRQILSCSWSDYGLSPSQSAFGYHSVHVHQQVNGAWFPEKGLNDLNAKLVRAIERNGGQVKTSAEVQRIHSEKGRACGVEVQGDFIRAETIVSNLDPEQTQRLLGRPHRRKEPEFSAVMALVKLRAKPARLGFGESNYRFQIRPDSSFVLFFPSERKLLQTPTAQIVVMNLAVNQSPESLCEEALQVVNRYAPGFRESIEEIELISPLYGVRPDRSWMAAGSLRCFDAETGIYQVGSHMMGPGFGAAVLSAAKTFAVMQSTGSWRTARQIFADLKQWNGRGT